jgi:prepilin-type N-terminal cleavage/methylation domain-containing protein
MILRKQTGRPLDRRGFTLMEVLVVVAILVILAGTASIFVFRYLDDAKKDRARFDIQALTQAAKTYMIRNGGTPPDNLGQVLQYIEGGSESNLIDPWNNQYQYQVTDQNGQQTIYIFATAPDGEVIDVIKH